MMLRERAVLVAVLGIALAGTAGPAAGQTAPQHGTTVRPQKGPEPDQAENPDPSTDLPAAPQEVFPEPVLAAEPPAPPPAATPQEPAPAPEAAAEPAQAEPPAAQPAQEPAPPPAPIVPAKTPEGRKLQQETALLLQLAQDLKAEILKAGNNTLSVVALRKIDEIQKMSKSLREEMSREQAAQQAAPGNSGN